MSASLAGRVALVIGGGCPESEGWGNGKATVVAMARAGATVGVFDTSRAAAAHSVDAARAEGGQAIPLVGDACSEADLAAATNRLLAEYGSVDVLHHNVGIADVGGPLDISREQWDRVLNVNLTSLFLAARAVLPSMLERQRGVITAISSVAGVRWSGVPLLSYAVTKAAVMQFAQYVALQYAARNIRANAIVVGKMDTPMVYRTLGAFTPEAEAELRAARAATCPSGKMGSAWDVAAASVFLASDDARYINGTSITVDGGLSAKC